MYDFILSMFIRRKVTVEQVQRYVGTFITQEEADRILATPQKPLD